MNPMIEKPCPRCNGSGSVDGIDILPKTVKMMLWICAFMGAFILLLFLIFFMGAFLYGLMGL